MIQFLPRTLNLGVVLTKKFDPNEVGEYLRSFQGELLPEPIFYAIAETMALPYVELVIFNAHAQHQQQVLLTRRGENDPYFPNLWHVPGTLLQSSDVTFHGTDLGVAIARLLNEELQGLEVKHLTFSGFHFHKVARGVGLSLVLTALAENEPKAGQYHGVNHLPEDMIKEQAVFILKAVRDHKPWERHP